jgi:MFS family permease
MTRTEKMIIALMGCSHALSHGYMLIFPAVLMLLKEEFAIGYLGLGVIGNIMVFTYGLGSFPGGLIYNRLGPKKIYLICFLGSAASCLIVAAAPNLLFLAGGLALVGALGSLYHPLANSLITFKVKEYGKGLGIHGATGNIGIAAAPFLAGIIASYWGWRFAYLWFALPGVAFSIWALSVNMSASGEKDAAAITSDSGPRVSFREYFSIPLIVLYAFNTLNAACFFGSVTFLPAFMAERTSFQFFSLDRVAMGGLLSGSILFTGVFGQLGGGILAQKPGMEKKLFLICTITFPLVLVLSFTQNLLLIISAVTFFFLNFSMQPMANTLVARYTSLEMRGTAFGIYFTISFGLGSLAASLNGYIAQSMGLQWVFLGLSMGSLLMMLLARLLLSIGTRFTAAL